MPFIIFGGITQFGPGPTQAHHDSTYTRPMPRIATSHWAQSRPVPVKREPRPNPVQCQAICFIQPGPWAIDWAGLGPKARPMQLLHTCKQAVTVSDLQLSGTLKGLCKVFCRWYFWLSGDIYIKYLLLFRRIAYWLMFILHCTRR